MAGPRSKAAAELEHVEEMCAEHFPLGWKHVPADHVGVSCEHGGWFRPPEPVDNTAVPPPTVGETETTPKDTP
jgi:hypothetical protein